jgi:hypothetical protein
LADGSESALITYDNSTNRNLYAAVTIKLGSITPATGGSITLRVLAGDGTDVPDAVPLDQYTVPLISGASAKVAILPMVRLYPFTMRLSIVNNSGVALAATDNELYCRDYNEDVS